MAQIDDTHLALSPFNTLHILPYEFGRTLGMARGTSSQHQYYERNHHHVFCEGHNYLSSQQNVHPVDSERNDILNYTDLVALPNHPHTVLPDQQTELRIIRAPQPQMAEPLYNSRDRDSNYAYRLLSRRGVKVSQQQRWRYKAGHEVLSSASAQERMTQFGCYSIRESQANSSPDGHQPEDVFLHGQKKAFSSCLYPKPVKIKLNVKPVEKPPEHMEASDFVRLNRNVRVSLMSSLDSPEQISLKLLHDLDHPDAEPDPENIEMPFELMPSPPPPDEVVEMKLLPVGDSQRAHIQTKCLTISSEVMRRFGIGAYVGLEMASQFAIYSFRVLNNGLHIYGPIVAKAAVSSYKGFRRGCKIFLHKSAPIAHHAVLYKLSYNPPKPWF